MLNQQPIEKKDLHEDGSLDIVDMWLTIQGEGPLVGSPAVFVRLAGCNLQCPACDSDYTSNRRRIGLIELHREISKLAGDTTGLIVFTGGEPLRQNIVPLVDRLIDQYTIQIETNGTEWVELSYDVMIMCSPKTPKVHPSISDRAANWKYVVQAGQVSREDGLPLKTLGNDTPVARPPKDVRPQRIFIQPLDEGPNMLANEANMQQAIHSCLTFGYRLSIQVHKICGLK